VKFAARRRLAKNGNSYTVAIPRLFLMAMRLRRGDPIDLVWDDDVERLTLTRGEPTLPGLSAARAGVRVRDAL